MNDNGPDREALWSRGILVHSSKNIIKNNVAKNNLLENIRVIINPEHLLFDSMSTHDQDSGRSRGYLVIKLHHL